MARALKKHHAKHSGKPHTISRPKSHVKTLPPGHSIQPDSAQPKKHVQHILPAGQPQHLLEAHTEDHSTADRFIYQRSRLLMFSAVTASALSLATFLLAIMKISDVPSILLFAVSLLTLGLSCYLFYSRRLRIVGIALIIFIITQCINTISGLVYSATLTAFNVFILTFLVLVFARVTALR